VVADDRPTGAPGWATGVAGRFLALAGGRAVAQVLATIWFFASARILSDHEYGVMSTGLVFFVVLAGLGDLGTNRTIVRYVAADHRMLWPTYWRAVVIRIAGGVTVGVLATVLIALLPVPVSPLVVALGAAIATASGVTELAYGGLRSVGRVRVEMVLLVAERSVFLAIALTVILRGGGPIAVLVIFVITNTASALVAGYAVWRNRPDDGREPGPLLDREARFTAASFALVTVNPQIGPVLLALLVGATSVGIFTVAQSPIEGMALFALSTATPVLPIIRSHLTSGRKAQASHVAVSVIGALVVGLTPLLVWFEVSPAMVLRLFFGEGRYTGAEPVLRLLALTAIAWCFRGVGEFVLLGHERAQRFLWITSVGTVVMIAMGVPFVLAHEAPGAAAAVLIGEVVMMLLLARAAPELADRLAWRAYLPAFVVATVSTIGLVLARGSTTASLVVLVALEVAAGLLAVRAIQALEHPRG